MRGIYKITNTNNGKCYIGKSEDLEKRLLRHERTLRSGNNRNKHLQSSFNISGGKGFIVEILEVLSENDDINARERYWIRIYRSDDRDYGYNKTEGGDGGNSYTKYLTAEELVRLKKRLSTCKEGQNNPVYHKHCYTDGIRLRYITDDEIVEYEKNGWIHGVPNATKEKERISNLGAKNGFFGKHHTEKTKQKIADGMTGNKNWNYGKSIYHKGVVQKFISAEKVGAYENDGWVKGFAPINREKVSKAKKGRKGKPCPNAVIYSYNGNEYRGWRAMKSYLNQHGYPRISEAAILKLASGCKVRGYDDLYKKIIIVK